MSDIQFEWDERKNQANKRKHKVSFEEAQAVFLDENATRYFDPDHFDDENRFVMIGMSFTLRVLVVCHCYRSGDSIIRIISARRADKQEQADYWS
ncbi:MAG: BrnT family toxin [Mariprofundales bacterium]